MNLGEARRHKVLMSLRMTVPFRALVFAALFGCGGSSATHLPPPPRQDTSIGVGDVFDVRVYGEDELSSTYRVSEDGSIDFPFIGRVAVVGLEPSGIASRITTRLREGGFLVEPHVSVLVREYNSKRISVVGAVASPGTFPLSPGMTVVQAISAAGGFTALANQNGTVLTRQTADGESVRVRIDAADIADGRAMDVPLQSGDLIFVPERLF